MKGIVMDRSITYALAALLSLAACSTGTLLSNKPENKISGTVTRGLIEPHRVQVTLDGKTYQGEWRTGTPTAEQKSFAGHTHRFHVGQVRSTLSATDGSTLDCQWQIHGVAGEGTCQAGNHDYPLTLK
jgi:hypothetical protein